jgi:hypothetical protein
MTDYTCLVGTEQNQPSYRHRIVELTDYEGKKIHVIVLALMLRQLHKSIKRDGQFTRNLFAENLPLEYMYYLEEAISSLMVKYG